MTALFIYLFVGLFEVLLVVIKSYFCVSQGTPEPEVDWYKDNRVIREGGRIKFTFEDDGLCSLLIREAEHADRGRYKCVASNPAGKAQCSAELFIESKYRFNMSYLVAMRRALGAVNACFVANDNLKDEEANIQGTYRWPDS